MTRDQFIKALTAAGISSSAAKQAAVEIEKVGATWFSPALANSIASGLKTNPNVSQVTAAELNRVVETYRNSGKPSAPKAPGKTPAPTRTPGSAGGGVLGGGGGSAERDAYMRRVQADAVRLLQGDWDPQIVPGPDVIAAARQIKEFLGTLGGQGADAQAEPGDVWDDLFGSIANSLGSGSGSGGGGGGGFGYDDPVDTPEEIDAFARNNYAYLAAYLDDPEIGPIIKQAAREQWDQGRLRGALSKTEWWKTTAQTAREFDAEKSIDPATWEQKVQTRVQEIQRQASLMGLSVSGKVDAGAFGQYDADYWLAVQSLREGWSPERINQAIFKAGGFQADKDYGQGMIGSQADQIKALAKAYMLPASEAMANSYAKAILEGTMNIDGVESMFRDMAKGRYPGLAAQIDGGIRPEQFFDTYKQQAAQLLEVDPDTIDLMNPKWSPMTEVVGQDGVRRPMTLSESADYLRSLPDYDRTDNAMTEASRVGELLAKTFGKVG